MPDSAAQSPRPFFGWRVLGAAFTAQLVANSLAFASFGLFVTELEREFGTDRATLSNGFGAAFLVSGLLGPLAGRAVDRATRASMLTGLMLCGGGMMLLSQAQALWQLGLIYAFAVVLGAVFCGPIASMSLVSRWFVRRRGLCAAIAVAGATLSSAISPPIAAWLIENFDWRTATLAMGFGGIALAFPIFSLFAIPSPESVGQHPDGDEAAPPASAVDSDARGGRELLRDRNFLVIAFGMALIFTSPIVFTLHFVPYAESLGFAKTEAAFVFTLLAAMSLTAKVLFGLVIDRIDPRYAIFSMSLLLATSWGILLVAPSFTGLMACGVLSGLGIGASAPIQTVLIARCFGRNGFGHALGMTGLIGLPLIAGANPLAGFLYVSTGTYRMGFLLEIALLLSAGLLFLALRLPSEEPVLAVVEPLSEATS